MTPCECEQPGYCPRHKCDKLNRWHELCRTNLDYFQLWEEGKGPCNGSRQTERQPVGECPHRGGVVRQARCDVCGTPKGELFDVLACGLHGECSIERLKTGIRDCRRCLLLEENVPGE